MNSKESNIKIDVKIGEEYIPLTVPFSQQDEVREVESELNLYMKELRNKVPNKGQKTYLAMAAYHFASYYFFLKGKYEEESEEAERLLREMSILCGDEVIDDAYSPSGDFGIF
ncbi:MAG: cell division protein ZapA [Muribaculaceae bacterium]|nr:cell division protein ZapA [Muribaculaceae bacterium]